MEYLSKSISLVQSVNKTAIWKGYILKKFVTLAAVQISHGYSQFDYVASF